MDSWVANYLAIHWSGPSKPPMVLQCREGRSSHGSSTHSACETWYNWDDPVLSGTLMILSAPKNGGIWPTCRVGFEFSRFSKDWEFISQFLHRALNNLGFFLGIWPAKMMSKSSTWIGGGKMTPGLQYPRWGSWCWLDRRTVAFLDCLRLTTTEKKDHSRQKKIDLDG